MIQKSYANKLKTQDVNLESFSIILRIGIQVIIKNDKLLQNI